MSTTLIAIAGCEDGPMQPEPQPRGSAPDVRPYVTGAAPNAVDGSGHFELPRAAIDGPYPQIDEEQATEIALGVVRTWFANPTTITIGTSTKARMEEAHGAPIDWEAVKPGLRAPYFAESHLEPLDPDLGWSAVRQYGPRFVVPLFVGETPVVVVSVAAYATNTSVDERGVIQRTGQPTGGEFDTGSIPLWLGGGTIPPGPETAVVFAAEVTGRKVTALPVLGRPGNHVSSVGSRWRIVLDGVVDFERLIDGESVTTDEVFVGVWPSFADRRIGPAPPATGLRLFVAADVQPEVQALGSGQGSVRPGYAVDLHEVRVAR